MNAPSLRAVLSLACAALLTAACTSTDSVETTGPAAPGPASKAFSAVPEGTPPAAASLTLSNGNTVEFYDFGRGVLVMESGKAGTPSGMPDESAPGALRKATQPSERLTNTWKSLAPDRPMPKSLIDIQDRWKTMASNRPAISREPKVDFGSTPFLRELSKATDPELSPLGKKATLEGCSNGCCDYAWLKTFYQCNAPSGWDNDWMLFNGGYSWANFNSISFMGGLVCSADGNSTWKVNIDGKGGTWTVLAGHYKTYKWQDGLVSPDDDMKSSVNSSTAQRLHTYCGYIEY